MAQKTINFDKMLACVEGWDLDIYCEHLHTVKQQGAVESVPLPFDRTITIHFCRECAEVPCRLQIVADDLLNHFRELGRRSSEMIH
jgi:hypothetical protein